MFFSFQIVWMLIIWGLIGRRETNKSFGWEKCGLKKVFEEIPK